MEKYKEKYQKLKENYTAKVTENKSLKEELLKYQVEVRTLKRGFSENGVYCGRKPTSRWRKKVNGTKLIFAITTLSNHSAKTNCYRVTSSSDLNS